MKISIKIQNSVNDILPALIVSIKTDMMAAYGEQFSALSRLNAMECLGNNEVVESAVEDLKALEQTIHLISDALDKAFKPKEVVRTSRTTLCPACHHRIANPNHSYCHRCGQKLIPKGGSRYE